jgi:integrase
MVSALGIRAKFTRQVISAGKQYLTLVLQHLSPVLSGFRTQFVPRLCPRGAIHGQIIPTTERKSMQNGSVIRAKRQRGQCLMRTIIRPAATKVGITRHIGWHAFRHTYSSLLGANRTDIKVTQELLRHASSRVTLDTYTQAVTVQKRERRAASFVFSRRLQRLLVETGLLGGVPNLCLLEMARSVRKYCRFNEMHSR